MQVKVRAITWLRALGIRTMGCSADARPVERLGRVAHIPSRQLGIAFVTPCCRMRDRRPPSFPCWVSSEHSPCRVDGRLKLFAQNLSKDEISCHQQQRHTHKYDI